ncbi:MAG TPA: LysE family transporter [Steroidobacteraceae bacterium]|nr:LysE family transporter [Steroidobacteraceae bacterium]
MPFLLKGLILGLSIAAPIGPIGVLCIRRAITEGAAPAFVGGLGAAAADAIYAFAGAFALSAIAQWIVEERPALALLGGVFLLYLGARTFLSKPSLPTLRPGGPPPGAWPAFLSTLLLTLANPMTILSFAAVFAGVGVPPSGIVTGHSQAALLLVLGVFLGSALWWLVLSVVAGGLRWRLGARTLKAVNWACGTALTAFGLYALAGVLLRT